ncbi:MAG: cation:proton antiporter [Patescibacteria group bacterium]
MTNLFLELGLIVALAGGLSLVASALKQPLIIAYIATGILAAPLVFFGERETIEVLAQIGVALLLFIVGLGLNPVVLKKIGRVALLTGVIQMAVIAAAAYALTRFFGYDTMSSLMMGAALAFSSTIIVVHILGERAHLERLYGNITVGILIVQDIAAIVLLMAFTSTGVGMINAEELAMLAYRGVALLFI